ncbi:MULTISPECIES: carbohydrate kinase family protein [Terrabacteria group]|uniref:carbohydrate kinase family protein n=1 Tax=Bacillati TaxID=1783272 RepID=UPI001C6DF448|nr:MULTISPECIES: carbohydrate kinase family protein [Terrabacteria group]MBW9212809.1 carbohydrate kinase family protein [Trueperella sp. zg.1013]
MKKICVVGGANIDICGSSLEPLRQYDSNPGEINLSFGGVGRNIAQICALLGEEVQFVTCFSSDPYAKMLQEDCRRLGMDISKSAITKDYPSSIYLAILDQNRDMKIAMSDMRILRAMDTAVLDKALEDLDEGDALILDANLDLNSIEYLTKHTKSFLVADPVSVQKSKRLVPILPYLNVFKPNQYEAEALTGIFVKDKETARQCLTWFLNQGMQEIIVSLADQGVILGSSEGMFWYRHRPIHLSNATGGGDSLLGAYVSERIRGVSPCEAIRFGLSATVVSIEQDAVRRRSLERAKVRECMESMNIQEEKL